MKQSKSKVSGELSEGEEKTQSGMLSSSGEQGKNISDTLESSATQVRSQVGFQPTKALGEPETTTNARIVVTFANALGALVQWRKIELVDGSVVIALCFPTNVWEISPNNELVVKVTK